MTEYTIDNIHEECFCEQCGHPLTTGDTAFIDDESGAVFCSLVCADERRDEIAELAQEIRDYDTMPPVARYELVEVY